MAKKLNDSDLLEIGKFRALNERIKRVRIDANVNFFTIYFKKSILLASSAENLSLIHSSF